MICHYPDLGSTSDWPCNETNLYRISAVIPQTPFCREPSKFWLFFQASWDQAIKSKMSLISTLLTCLQSTVQQHLQWVTQRGRLQHHFERSCPVYHKGYPTQHLQSADIPTVHIQNETTLQVINKQMNKYVYFHSPTVLSTTNNILACQSSLA